MYLIVSFDIVAKWKNSARELIIFIAKAMSARFLSPSALFITK